MGAFQADAFEASAFFDEGGASVSSGYRRVSQSWNIDRVQAMFSMVQGALGQVKKQQLDFIKPELRPEAETASEPMLDFIPTAKPYHEIRPVITPQELIETQRALAKRRSELELADARIRKLTATMEAQHGELVKRREVRQKAILKRTKRREEEREEDDEILMLGL